MGCQQRGTSGSFTQKPGSHLLVTSQKSCNNEGPTSQIKGIFKGLACCALAAAAVRRTGSCSAAARCCCPARTSYMSSVAAAHACAGGARWLAGLRVTLWAASSSPARCCELLLLQRPSRNSCCMKLPRGCSAHAPQWVSCLVCIASFKMARKSPFIHLHTALDMQVGYTSISSRLRKLGDEPCLSWQITEL